MKESFDVVIVGGAAMGSAAAYFLAANPAFTGKVLVLEQDFSYQKCATTLSAASIRHQFSTPGNIRMSQFGSDFIGDIGTTLAVDGEAPDVGFVEGGYLFLATAAGVPVLRSNHRIQRDLGADVVLLSATELVTRFPWLVAADLTSGSLGLSGEGWLDAYALLQAFRRKAVALGVTYRQARASELVRSGDRITEVELANGSRIGCGNVINAAGTGAAALACSAGIALPVQSRKRCVFHFTSPAVLPDCPLENLASPKGHWR